MMQDLRNLFVLFSFLLCFVPSLQQGWTGNNAMQPSWQSQPGAAQTQSVQAQPVQQPPRQTWNQQGQQQPASTQTQPTQASKSSGSGVGVRMLSLRAGDGKTTDIFFQFIILLLLLFYCLFVCLFFVFLGFFLPSTH